MELCKVCKKGYLTPTGKAGVGGEDKEPFRETESEREVKCDNPECATNQTNYGRQIYEPDINIGESLTAQVTKAEELEKLENNPKICTVCQNEKEIVYRKENVKLCRECLDKIKSQDER